MEAQTMKYCGGSVEIAADLLALTSRRDGRDTILMVRGELDLATAPLLERALAELINDQSCRTIVLDLHDLDFMGSTGLSLLLKAQDHAQNRGGELSLTRPSSAVMRTIQLAGLLSVFTIHGDAAPSDRATTP
jgi:anti-sigma B factor antagonist